MRVAIEEEEDPWDLLDEEFNEEIEKEITENINDNYLKEKFIKEDIQNNKE